MRDFPCRVETAADKSVDDGRIHWLADCCHKTISVKAEEGWGSLTSWHFDTLLDHILQARVAAPSLVGYLAYIQSFSTLGAQPKWKTRPLCKCKHFACNPVLESLYFVNAISPLFL